MDKCIEKCKAMDDIRMTLTHHAYGAMIKQCNFSILELCRNYDVNPNEAAHALMIAQRFVSTEPINRSPTLMYYWTMVGVVCFTLAIKFRNVSNPILKDTLPLVLIDEPPSARKYYIKTQSIILNEIK